MFRREKPMTDEQHAELSAQLESSTPSPTQPAKPLPWRLLIDLLAIGLLPAFSYVAFMWFIDDGSVVVLAVALLALLAFVLWRLVPRVKSPPDKEANNRLPLADAAVGFLLFVPMIGLLTAAATVVVSLFTLCFKPAARRSAVIWMMLCLCAVPAHFSYSLLLARARDCGKSAACGMNLSNLGKAIAIYRASYDNQSPPSLDAIMQDGSQWSRMLVCFHDPYFWDNRYRTDDYDGSSYFYCAPTNNDDYDMPADKASIMACDTVPRHLAAIFRFDRYYHALLSNHSVQRYTESEFQRELQKPHNRRFAEELAKGANMTPQERLHYIAPRGEK
jgi:hypothetical protein